VLSHSVCDSARALGYLGTARSAVGVEEVSHGTGLFRPSPAKLMGTLVRKGFVTTLFDLCTALDDPLVFARCLLGGRHHDGDAVCPARDLERRHREEILAFLRETSVVDAAAAFPDLRTRRRPPRHEYPGRGLDRQVPPRAAPRPGRDGTGVPGRGSLHRRSVAVKVMLTTGEEDTQSVPGVSLHAWLREQFRGLGRVRVLDWRAVKS
jgi:DNA-binding IscR family transcriptional regulator